MQDSSSPAKPSPAPQTSQLLRGWLPALALGIAFWLLLFNQQRLEWTVNPTYAYGWAVPLLAGYLLWERWGNRPAVSSGLPPRWLPLALSAAALLAYLPLRVIHESDPDWVKINWLLEGLCLTVSFSALFTAGGWRYLMHFGFPLLFCFTALPWPVWMEDYLVQNLMKGNAAVCADVMTMMGTPALAKGNLIQVGTAWVNVEEACSGIRSLQTAFMMALFLGEFNRLGLLRRVILLLSSFGVAALFNALRTLALTYFSTQGTIDKWHDTVGNTAMVLTLLLTWLVSEVLRRWRAPAKPKQDGNPGQGERSSPFPLWFCAAGILFLVGSEIATEAWFRYKEGKVPAVQKWSIAWPEKSRRYQESKLHERTLALLKYNRGTASSWVSDYGYGWQMYFLEWDPGRVSKHLAQSHYPTVCLPATGLTLVGETGAWDCTVKGIRIPFNTYIFREGNQDLYIFHAIMEDRPLEPDYRHTYYQVGPQERFAAALRGERNLGQKVMGIALRGPTNPTEARYEVSRMLRKIVDTTPAPSTK